MKIIYHLRRRKQNIESSLERWREAKCLKECYKRLNFKARFTELWDTKDEQIGGREQS